MDPHPDGGVWWARGVVPTPHGDLAVSWKKAGTRIVLSVKAPPGTVWTNAQP